MKKEDETEGRKAVFIVQELAPGLYLVLSPEQEININNNNGTTSDGPRSSDRMTACGYPSSWSKLFFTKPMEKQNTMCLYPCRSAWLSSWRVGEGLKARKRNGRTHRPSLSSLVRSDALYLPCRYRGWTSNLPCNAGGFAFLSLVYASCWCSPSRVS